MNKNIKIFAQEHIDGVDELMFSNSVARCISPAVELLDCKKIDGNNVAIASLANPNQIDLFYLRSVLVSTGWNNNDDVFMPEEVWPARKTPEDKQFNNMHNETDIIGHITGNYVADFDNNPIPDDVVDIPRDFNIVTDAVIYTSWSDPELMEKVNTLIEGIRANEKYVSMECLFPHFDYMLKNSQGQTKLIARTEATAYLTKYLRAYGGSGVYLNYTIGRVLRNITFSGKGLVDRPANPKSVILSIDIHNEDKDDDEEDDSLESESEKTEKITSGEKYMSLELTQELESVKSELAQAKLTIENLTSFKGQAETLQSSVAELNDQLKALNSQLEASKAELAIAVKAKDEAEAKMKKMECEQKMQKRKACLVDAGLEDGELEDSLASMEALADEAFDKVVALMKKNKAKYSKDKKDEEEAKDKKSEASETVDEIKIVVEPEKTAASINDLGKNDKTLRETMSAWISESLKTLK